MDTKDNIKNNEKLYGNEIREIYGSELINKSYKKMKVLSKNEQEQLAKLTLKINNRLKLAVLIGDPSGVKAQQVCALHKEWICHYWPTYTKEAHMELVEMYLTDERFTAYYDTITKGSAKFLRDSMKIFLLDK